MHNLFDPEWIELRAGGGGVATLGGGWRWRWRRRRSGQLHDSAFDSSQVCLCHSMGSNSGDTGFVSSFLSLGFQALSNPEKGQFVF